MGSVVSYCESCFGNTPDPSKSKPQSVKPRQLDEKPKYHTNVYSQVDSLEYKDTIRSLRSITPKPIKKRGNSALPRVSRTLSGSHDFNADKDKKYTIKDFDLVKVLGRGAFGKVYLVTKKGEKRYYALKTLKKKDFHTKGQIDLVLTEKNVLQNAVHPFIVRLHCSFQSDSTLYLVMDFLPGGELLTHLKNRGVFDEQCARFYAAEIILGLQYLHEELNIIYRDLKPENILIDATGHAKITDFGLSTTNNESRSFCGTLGYVAPEVLTMQTEGAEQNEDIEPYGKTVDWWSLGCLIYEMLTGFLPFSNIDKDKMVAQIMENEPIMPYQISDTAKDLLLKLLEKDPKKRLGYNGAEEIKQHPFFAKIDWSEIFKQRKAPPITPNLTRATDLKHFNKEYLNQPAAETPMHTFKTSSDSKEQFPGFTYVPLIE